LQHESGGEEEKILIVNKLNFSTSARKREGGGERTVSAGTRKSYRGNEGTGHEKDDRHCPTSRKIGGSLVANSVHSRGHATKELYHVGYGGTGAGLVSGRKSKQLGAWVIGPTGGEIPRRDSGGSLISWGINRVSARHTLHQRKGTRE